MKKTRDQKDLLQFLQINPNKKKATLVKKIKYPIKFKIMKRNNSEYKSVDSQFSIYNYIN